MAFGPRPYCRVGTDVAHGFRPSEYKNSATGGILIGKGEVGVGRTGYPREEQGKLKGERMVVRRDRKTKTKTRASLT